MLKPYRIIKEIDDKSRIRLSEPISTEIGDVYKHYIGKVRILQRKVSKKKYAKEAYRLRTRKYDLWNCKYYWDTSKKIYWERVNYIDKSK